MRIEGGVRKLTSLCAVAVFCSFLVACTAETASRAGTGDTVVGCDNTVTDGSAPVSNIEGCVD